MQSRFQKHCRWGHVRQALAADDRLVHSKLDNVLPDEQRNEVAWARQTVLSLGTNWSDPNLAAPFLEQLRDAIREHRRVRMWYRSRNQHEPAQRDVDPYKLVSRWGMQYCIGYCHERQALRTFRLERIADIQMLDHTFAEPSDLDLQNYLANNPFFQPQVRGRLRFAPESAITAFNNRAYWESIEQHADGSVEVSFAAPDLEAAAGLVLRIGFPATIIEPTELRELVRVQARALANHFDTHDQPMDELNIRKAKQ